MTLFDKLFSLKRRLDSDKCDLKHWARSCQINPEQVRLLLFKECDWRGRKLLFDSATIQRVPAGKHDKPSVKPEVLPCIVEVSDGFSYLYKGPEADANVLGEMIFGAVAMNYKNVSLKIHIMDEPRRVMCTKVFCMPARRMSRVDRKTSDWIETCSTARNVSLLRNASKPLNVPSLREDGMALSFSMDRGDSGFCGDQSSYSSVDSTNDYITMFEDWDGNSSQEDFYSFHSLPGRKLSTSSNGSFQRRTFQNIVTRFELGQSSQLLNVPTAATSSDSQIYSNSSASGTSDSIASGSTIPQRKSKLGLAVLITVTDSDQLDVVRKCVEQCPRLEALVCRLRVEWVRAGSRVSTLHRAAAAAREWLSDLLYGPRLQPRWLSLATADASTSNKMAESLLADLCSVLAVADTKTTNFFISTLLTHVLTYHLGWVTTVSPYDTTESNYPQSKIAPRPYNALWAQLSDLCGSIGFPPRAARTIISGEKNTQFVNRLLSVLTYFLRCGDVKRTEFHYKDCQLKETKTINVNRQSGLKRNATRIEKLDSDGLKVINNTQNSDSSASTLVASDVSLKKTDTLADSRQKLSTSPECSGSKCLKPTCPIRRNPTMMLSSLKASSDSSLNSSVSEDFVSEQNVVFVLGDDEQLVGLKNKSTNGKCVKKSSKIHNEPVVLEQQERECNRKGCEDRNTESPSKCCGQTLQHSKPIKHSGFKFEFDKYPQIVTNYMKSKNLEILDRHYIGKPGNLKLDNFQFDPMVVPPIQEEKCDACVKCQMMESMLQTPTNASEMEYMNDMPRISEPQYAKETLVTDSNRQHREISPKTFVRRRKENVVVVNLISNLKFAEGVAKIEAKSLSEGVTSNKTESISTDVPLNMENTLDNEIDTSISTKTMMAQNVEHTGTIYRADRLTLKDESTLQITMNASNSNQTHTVELYKSDINANIRSNILEKQLDTDRTSIANSKTLEMDSIVQESISSNKKIKQESITSQEMRKISIQDAAPTNPGETELIKTEFRPLQMSNRLKLTKSTNNLKTLLSLDTQYDDDVSNKLADRRELDQMSIHESKVALIDLTKSELDPSNITTEQPVSNIEKEPNSKVTELEVRLKASAGSDILPSDISTLSISSNDTKVSEDNSPFKTNLIATDNSSILETNKPPYLKPLVFRRPERRINREREKDRVIEVKSVTEFSLPVLCKTELKQQQSGFDELLLGGVTDHYVPDLILQGTKAKPASWEPELKRDLDITSYLNKQTDAPPVQAVAIIGDTNSWEVRVVGRECGTGGMSSLVGAMLDTLPAMRNAKVPAHQCLAFLESKLREFCVLSKTLADMLMSTDFCDIATLTKSLNIDINDVPLLLAVASTHTPQVATRYGISYR